MFLLFKYLGLEMRENAHINFLMEYEVTYTEADGQEKKISKLRKI